MYLPSYTTAFIYVSPFLTFPFTVMLVMREALRYDVRHGKISVGTPVRDAACYISWSFARAYDPVEMKPFVHQLAS